VRALIYGEQVEPLSTFQREFEILGNKDRLEGFGFKLAEGGAHISRTIMLREITQLVGRAPARMSLDDYRRAVVEENLLGKATETTRQKTFRHLRELYSLSDKVPIFALYRDLVRFDSNSIALLSLLTAWARDPLLRATTPAVLQAKFGDQILGDDLQRALTEAYPHQYSQNNIGKVARNAAASWTQSGHLSGRTKKLRSRVQPRPAALTFALILGYVGGITDTQLFSSMWCRLLDLDPTEARSLAEQAHRQELITLRAVGLVVEIRFPRFGQLLKGVQ
jgi:hypothetical protein